jgi:hypothetical protein
MFALVLFAQLAIAQHAIAQPASDSTYTTPALRAFIAAASDANRRVPDSLASYSSRIETETSLLIRDTLGREHTSEVEQFASDAHWDRDGRYDLHIVGYRSQSVGVPYSTLTIARGWTVPVLYGERLSLGVYFNRSRGRESRDSLTGVHPFARDRDEYYRFSGGDTVTTLQAGGRRIPIVRVRVQPLLRRNVKASVFDGELDIDAERKQIVRMRGQFVVVGAQPSRAGRILEATLGVTAAAYVEFVNAEVDGKYWLPAFQRTEFQAEFAIFGQTRPVFRVMSTIRDMQVVEQVVAADSLVRARVAVTWAPTDSVNNFAVWRTGLGEQSAGVHADDFGDLAPAQWRSTGPPRFTLFPNNTAKILRFNRVEGTFVGLAPTVDFRSFAPGLSAGAFGGWAFSEKTVRGGGFVEYRTGADRLGVRGERALASTNDFTLPFGEDPGFSALLASIDDNDYLDRSTVLLSWTRTLGSLSGGLLTLQGGAGRDRSEMSRLTRGLFGTDHFRPNRGIDEGDYAIGSLDLELHPNVTGDFVAPGLGAHLHQEAGTGDFDWQRTELGLSARKYYGPFSLAAHLDGGLVTGDVPPQKLFELGGAETLPGYDYKEFAGDRAAIFRGYASYRFGFFKRPIRIRNFFLPAIDPGLGASVQGGWAELSSQAARGAVRELGLKADGTPLSAPTNGMRATVGGGLTLFSDLLHIGASRPIDHGGRWRFSFGGNLAF